MKKSEEPDRPPCAKCGGPASTQATLTIQRLTLDRDAGPRTVPYWKPSYHNATRLEVLLCQSCTQTDFKFDIAVTGSVVADRALKA